MDELIPILVFGLFVCLVAHFMRKWANPTKIIEEKCKLHVWTEDLQGGMFCKRCKYVAGSDHKPRGSENE